MKDKTRGIIIETGSIFRQHLALILKEKDRILASPELSDTHIPKLFVRDKFIKPPVTISPTIGGLLRIWDKGLMQIACPCCRSGIVYGYYLDIDATAHLFGVCASRSSTPGWTVTQKFSMSYEMILFIFVVQSTMPPAIGTHAPARPVPAPRVVTGMLCSQQSLTIAAISSVESTSTSIRTNFSSARTTTR